MLEDYRVTRNFRYSEFSCPHCGRNRINVALIEKLQEARDWSNELGAPIYYSINSGFRCPTHNEDVGGTEDSAHLDGLAADIAIRSDHYRMCILYGVIKAGFTRIGSYSTFIHVDIRDTDPIMWRG